MSRASELFCNRRGRQVEEEQGSGLSNRYIDRRRYSPENERRLPAAVVLARERLAQRLRGVSLSGSSSHASSNSSHWSEANLRSADAGAPSETTPGLSTRALRTLPVEEFNLLDSTKAFPECSICLESFQDRDKLTRLPCGHRFHYSCLVPWVRICGCCPYCRIDIVT